MNAHRLSNKTHRKAHFRCHR